MEGQVDVAKRVTVERTRRGWSQRQAAERAGINNVTWGRIEKGEPLSDRSRAKIAEVFDWPLDWPNLPTGDVASVSRLDDLEQRVADLEAFVRSLTRSLLGQPGQGVTTPEADLERTQEERRRLRDRVAELERDLRS